MIESSDLKSTIIRINSILSDLKIPFHITGGLSSSFYGEPRFTQDIDIVINLKPDSTMTEALIDKMNSAFILDREAVIAAIRNKRLFQALDEESMIKIDFHVGASIPYELERSCNVEIYEGVTVPLVSKEDAILSKLQWIKNGNAKSIQDVKMMLKLSDDIDMSSLKKIAKDLDIYEILESIIKDL